MEGAFRGGPWRVLALLWLASLVLALAGLGNLPLRDWDEAIVARVALELSDRGWPDLLLPTLWDREYLNKPPGLHLAIAAVVRLWRWAGHPVPALPPEGVIRLVPAVLSTFVVPLCGAVQWRLRPGDRAAAIATAAIALTLLPLVRHGRLAMLDGTLLSAMALLWLALLSARAGVGRNGEPVAQRRNSNCWGAVAGLAASAMLLLKAPLLLPALAAGLLPLAIETAGSRRRWTVTPSTWAWMALGTLPGGAWHLWHAIRRGEGALWQWLGDGAGRVLLSSGEGSDLGWRVPVTEVFEGGWPWLVLWPFGVALAWRQRHTSAGLWPLCLQGVMALAILPLKTQLPWYSHPLWVPLALLCGPVLAWLVRRDRADAPPGRPVLARVPWLWAVLGASAVVASLAGLLGLGWAEALGPLSGILAAGGSGWCAGALLLRSPAMARRRLGAALTVAGSWLALLLLMASPLWLWELNEQWSVRPVAALARQAGQGSMGLLGAAPRPSLSWYAGRPIEPFRRDDRSAWLLQRQDAEEGGGADLRGCRPVSQRGGWRLLRCADP